MRIAFDQQIFATQRYGGISRYFVELASRLAAMNETGVDVVAPLHVNAYLGKLGGARLIGPSGPPLRRLTATPQALLADALATAWLASHRYDIVHQTYFAGRRTPRKVAVIVTVHDMIHERFPAYFPPWDLTARRKRRAVERADRVIAVSATTRRDLIEFLGVAPEKVSVVHHGCDLPGVTASVPPDFGPYLLYVGARGGYKNFAAALEAYARTPALHRNFRLVCFGSADFIARERAVLTRHGVARERLRWLSGNDEALAHLYMHATALVYPSLWEGFGMPLLEAMSLGCPVAASGIPAIEEVAGAAAELFDPRSPDAIAAALERVAYSSDRRSELRRLGRDRAAQFSWDRCARETRAIYEDAVRGIRSSTIL